MPIYLDKEGLIEYLQRVQEKLLVKEFECNQEGLPIVAEHLASTRTGIRQVVEAIETGRFDVPQGKEANDG